MAKQPELYTDPLTGVENDPYAGTVNRRTGLNPAAQSGTDALRAGLVDQAFTQQPAAMYSQFELPTGLSTPPSSYGLPSLESLIQPARPKIRLGYDREQGKYLINNTVVDVRDIETLERVPDLLQQPASPETPAGNWQPISLQTLKQNKDALLDISIGERIGFGARDVAGSIPAGLGRLAEFAGAEQVGGALVGLGERLETDEFDQARQAAVAESENVFQSIAGAVPQGLPSVITSVGSSVLGGAIGGAAAGPAGIAIGAIIGGASTIFPMMVNSAYDTALQQQGEDFVNSSQGRAEILGTAMATTGIQMIPGMQVTGKVVPAVMQRAATQVANKATSGIAGEAAKIGFSEGMAEMMALVVEQVAFDPETRAMMSEGEVQAMLPYVAETYGREAAVAFAAGAILGGGIGAVTGAVTRRAPSEETNLLEPEEGPTPTEPTTGGPLVPTDTTPAGPESQQPIRGTGPQGVLPMEGLGGQIERARRSRAVGYQPPRTGEQTNLLDRPPTAQGEPQLSLDLQEPAPIQGELFPAPGAQQLRRGVQPVEDVIPPAPPIEVGPTQRELFTRRGLPTAAARAATLPQPESGAVFGRVDGSPFRTEVSALGQRKRVARETGIPVNELETVEADGGFFLTRAGEETTTPETTPVAPPIPEEVTQDAIQEPSPAEVPAREPAAVSPEVGEGIPSVQEPARARQEDIIQQAQEADQEQVVQEDVVLSSDADFVNDLIGIIDTTKDTTLYEESVTTLLDWGHNADSNNKRAGLDRLAFEYLNELPVDNSVRNAVLKFARYQSKQIPATTKKGEFTPTFNFILRTGTFDTIYKRFGFAKLPDNMRPADKEIAKNVETEEQVSTDKGFENAEALSREINRINSLVGRTRSDRLQDYRKNLTELYTKVVENGQQDFEVDPVRQTTLADYFLADGGPRIIERDGRAIVSPTEDAEAAPRILTDYSEWDAATEERIDELGLGDFAEFGRFSTLDGDPITKPMEMGKVRMQVNAFRNKLRVKPKTFVFRTQADLQASNPELYQRAVDARPQGDFDTRLAAGYSFGTGADATVIIFSDRIKNTDHLNFVLAHETLGHFGFRSLLPAREFNKFMVDIYNEGGPTSALAQEVDAAMNANPDLSLAEAVEEYLADYAAQLDVSLIGRIANFIKRALNKLGIKYPDDAARYLVDQSRRYVRNGNRSSMFVTSDVLSRVRAIELGEDPDGTGRFAPTTTLSEANIAASLLDIVPEGAQDKARDYFRKVKMNTPEDLDAFKNSLFNLFVFRARENEGLSEGHDIIKRSRGLAMSLRRKHQEKLAVVLDRAVMDKLSNVRLLGGATKAQVDTVNRFLYAGLQAKLSEFSPKDLGTDSLFTLDSNGNYVENSTEINRLFNMGNLTLEQMRDGFTYVKEVEEAGETVTKTVTVEGIPGLTEDSIEWKGYIAAREVMRDVELELLKTKLNAFTEERAATFTELGLDMEDNQLSPQARQFLERIYKRYSEIYTDGSDIDESGAFIFADDAMSRSNEFIKAVNTAVIAKERSADDTVAAERNAEVAKFFPNIPPQEIDAAIEAFKAERKQTTDENRYTLQTAFKNLVTQELADEQANLYVRSNLAQGYIPLRRRGKYQVRVEAFDEDGNRVVLRKEYKNQLVYKQVETISDATKLRGVINEAFKGQTFPVEIYNEATNQFEIKEVTLKASASVVKNASSAPPNINLNDFTTGLRRFSINVPPAQMGNIIKELTRQNDNARNKLKRELVPGFDEDALRAVAEHVESRASVIAKTAMAPRLLELTNTRLEQTKKKWEGDEEKLANLKARLDAVLENPNATEGDIKAARRDYNRYLYMFNKTRPANGVEMGNKYFNEFSGLLQFIQNNEDINESDFARGPVVSAIRASTSIMQLGGSIATGALNYMALYTNYLPYMSSYNEKNGFGGGFAFGEVNRELFRAMNKVGLAKSIGDTRLNTAEFYDQIAQSKALQDQFDLTAIEAAFMATEIREGVMIPAQINMLTELALGRIKNAGVRRTIEGYMWTFNATERASRRAAGLAAFRLEFKRRRETGMSEAQAAEFARQFAVEAIDVSLGDYAVTNRPAAWRSGWQSFLYIYKIFPTTSIQMLSRLPRDGQLKMLTTLWILSGVSGLPFAEDLEDMVDTIAQTLGWDMGSIRLEAAKLSDSIIPGSSPTVLSGFMRSFITPDIASRTSLGDFIPGTAVFLAGSNTTREIQEIAGPAASMITGVGTGLVTALRAATTEQVTFEDVLRSGPITGGRMLGDTMAYLRSGAVVDKRGYVVTPEMGWSTVASRLLGFYPSAAADQYEVIRVSKRLNDYQREVSAGFRYGWIKAKIAGDERQARAIEEAVREWNEGARGSALEIRNFRKNAVRALREARRPATERLRKSAPIAAREDMDRVANLIGY